MSEGYSFTGDKALLTHDGTVVWNEQVAARSSLDFSNVTDTTLNESYATAVGDNDNETQYLSVLETTNEVSLEDLHNLTLGTPKMGTQENIVYNENELESLEVNDVDMGDQQVVVFSLDGSDDLYGIQVAQDEEGNMQKYQFKFRTTEDGQLEAIPESIQLFPNDVVQEEGEEETQQILQEPEEDQLPDSQVYLQEESEVQETEVYLQEEEIVEEEEERSAVLEEQVYIKGEPDAQVGEEEEDEEVEEEEYPQDGESQIEEELQFEEEESEVPQEDNYEEETVDVKTGILEETLTYQTTPLTPNESPAAKIKQELLHEESPDEAEDPTEYVYKHQEQIEAQAYEDSAEEELQHNVAEEDYETVTEVVSDQETVLEYHQQHYQMPEEETEFSDDQAVPNHLDHYEHLFVQDKQLESHAEEGAEHLVDEGQHFLTQANENESDNDDYEVVEGLHITAEGDIDETSCSPSLYQEPETILQEVSGRSAALERANILKQPTPKNIREIRRKNKTIVYYVMPRLQEKENVNSMLPLNNATVNKNPRSILKSSFPKAGEQLDLKVVQSQDERMNKRFARSKEAVQARLFNNFISKTTIPSLPVRQTRLPRKQQMKPVDTRRDEEIIVQEVMVSSNGFIENIEEKLRNKDKLEVTTYVDLTDSDDDYDPKNSNKKKKKHKKHKKLDVDDSDDSDASVIEILHSDDEILLENNANRSTPKALGDNSKRGRGRPRKSDDPKEGSDSLKRRRGRPPKESRPPSEGSGESPVKKSRTESDATESDTAAAAAKKEIKCPHCVKTFASRNSLSTHIQHHNLENSLRNSQAGGKAPVKTNTAIEYKHKCDDCHATFKNSILLKRHACSKAKKFACGVCTKNLPDQTMLNIHQRSHVKENLLNATTIAKVSPKKFLPRASTSKFKSPKKLPLGRGSFKCKECSKVCFSQASLNVHERTHQKFKCLTCNTAFSSRLLLDTHVRVSCVKAPSPSNKRLSCKIRRSFVASPRRASSNLGVRRGVVPGTNADLFAAGRTLAIKVDCDNCGMKFTSHTALFKHKVKEHGLHTPDKSVLVEQKKGLHKPKLTHGGIPAHNRLRQAFAGLRSKLELTTLEAGNPSSDKGASSLSTEKEASN